MKPPQLVALLLLVAGLGLVALKRGESEAVAVPASVAIGKPSAEAAPEPEPEPVAPVKRPLFSGPHDGSHVYQGMRCPACEMGPVEF